MRRDGRAPMPLQASYDHETPTQNIWRQSHHCSLFSYFPSSFLLCFVPFLSSATVTPNHDAHMYDSWMPNDHGRYRHARSHEMVRKNTLDPGLACIHRGSAVLRTLSHLLLSHCCCMSEVHFSALSACRGRSAWSCTRWSAKPPSVRVVHDCKEAQQQWRRLLTSFSCTPLV